MQRRVVTLALFLLVPAAQDARAAKKAVAPPPPPPREEKLARLLELEDRRSAGGDELAQLLRDPDRGVRRRAALAAVGQRGARERIRAEAARLGLVEGADLVAVA
jgi:hypothetical protein